METERELCRIGACGYGWMYLCELEEGHPLPHTSNGVPFRPGARGCMRTWSPIRYNVRGRWVTWDPNEWSPEFVPPRDASRPGMPPRPRNLMFSDPS